MQMLSDKPNLKWLVVATIVGLIVYAACTGLLIFQYPDGWRFFVVLMSIGIIGALFNAWIAALIAWWLHKQFPNDHTFDEKIDLIANSSSRSFPDDFRRAWRRKRIYYNILRWSVIVALCVLLIVVIGSRAFLPVGGEKSRQAAITLFVTIE